MIFEPLPTRFRSADARARADWPAQQRRNEKVRGTPETASDRRLSAAAGTAGDPGIAKKDTGLFVISLKGGATVAGVIGVRPDALDAIRLPR